MPLINDRCRTIMNSEGNYFEDFKIVSTRLGWKSVSLDRMIEIQQKMTEEKISMSHYSGMESFLNQTHEVILVDDCSDAPTPRCDLSTHSPSSSSDQISVVEN